MDKNILPIKTLDNTELPIKELDNTELPIKEPIRYVSWPVQNVRAFTTTRQHPFIQSSQLTPSHFDHFNLGDHVGDCTNKILANRHSLIKLLPDNASIQWLDQVHGAKVIELTRACTKKLSADAVITREKNIALAIMTADCLPILLSDKKGGVIAAIHGGWRPLAKNIIQATVNKMAVCNSEIYAWLGPCIGNSAFEVGGEVKDIFTSLSTSFSCAFSQKQVSISKERGLNSQSYLADLQLIAHLQLQQLGIKHIFNLTECTYAQEQDFYSYRRDKKTGRMASIICRN